MEEKNEPHDTVLEIHNGFIDVSLITERIDKAIPKITIEAEVEDGKVSE